MSEWIKAVDELPDYNEPVVVLTKRDNLMVARLVCGRHDQWIGASGYKAYVDNVICWCRIPELPDGVDSE